MSKSIRYTFRLDPLEAREFEKARKKLERQNKEEIDSSKFIRWSLKSAISVVNREM